MTVTMAVIEIMTVIIKAVKETMTEEIKDKKITNVTNVDMVTVIKK